MINSNLRICFEIRELRKIIYYNGRKNEDELLNYCKVILL